MEIRALLVDDEPNILLTLGLVLQSHGIQVQTAESVGAAKAHLASEQFDVVVTDLNLEQPLSGCEIVRTAKLLSAKPATIVLSGFPDLLSTWRDCGADAGLQKPTDIPELLRTIDRLLAYRGGKRIRG
jgi:two-component system OmpR family response regulator